MSPKLIRRVVEFFVVVFVLGICLDLLRSILAAMAGEFGTLNWHVSAADPRIATLGTNAQVAWSDGILSVTGQPFGHLLDLTAHIVSAGLLLLALIALRRLLLAFAEGAVFTPGNIGSLRRIGQCLLTVCAISVVATLALQSIIMGAAEMPADTVLHPSLSRNVAEVDNLWMEYDVPIFTFLLGGLALLLAAAFENGMAYREDSESVV